MMRNSSRILALLIVTLASAQERVGRVQVFVAPDHADWKYEPGEQVTFTIQARRDGAPVSGLGLTWSVGPEMLEPTQTRTVELGADGARVAAGTMKEPGFLRLLANVREGERTYRGLGTAGFAPEKIQPVTRDPESFDKFWRDSKEALAKIPIDAQRTLLPELSTAAHNAYLVSLQNIGPGARGVSRVFGVLTEPKAPGKYPALLRVPGAGVHPLSNIAREPEEGVIMLSIGIHGIPLNQDPKLYPLLAGGALNRYWSFNIDSRDTYYYLRVYLGCVRAVDYLAGHPSWDGKTLGVSGGSQGGALSIITAALDPRIQALSVYHPALADMAGYVNGRAGGWPGVFRDPANRTKEKLATAEYYDVVNFARRLKVPGIYSWGYNDEVFPPTSIYAAYNVISAPKTLLLALETGHAIVPEQSDRMTGWMREYLKTGKAPAPR